MPVDGEQRPPNDKLEKAMANILRDADNLAEAHDAEHSAALGAALDTIGTRPSPWGKGLAGKAPAVDPLDVPEFLTKKRDCD